MMKKKNKLIALLVVLLLVTPSAFVDTHMIVGNVNNIRFADQYTGSDCGAKINVADTELGSAAGEIWVNNSCGLAWTNPVNLNAGHVLRFSQGGTYNLSAGITMAGNSVLAGMTSAMAVNTTPAVMLQMASGQNLSALITVNGPYAVIQDLAIDGNKSNNATGGSGIVATHKASRLELNRVTAGNFQTNGVTLNGVASPKIFKLMTYQNSNDGLFCNGTSGGGDAYVTDSEFENNLGNGVEINSCPAWRINHSDFGQNSQTVPGSCGLNIYGASRAPANFEIITNNQFGGQFRDDLCINGSGNTSVGSNIVGNSFIGSGFLLAANTYSHLVLVDGGLNVVSGNVFSASPRRTPNQYAISVTETHSGGGLGNRIVDNVFVDSADNGGSPPWGTARVLDSTANGITCFNSSIVLSAGWGAGNAVSSANGYFPNCSFVINSGRASFSAAPTVTLKFPGSLIQVFNETPVCQLNVVAITGSGGSILFNPTSTSLTSTVWTAQSSTGAAFTPTSSETYKVVLSCSP
jgi:hypothetical protein